MKDDGVYEIRLQIDGVRISASSRFLDEAKIKFLQKLKLFEKGDLQARQHAEKSPSLRKSPAPAFRFRLCFAILGNVQEAEYFR
ncbi:MAG: hypothetical protein ACLUHK_07200 [Eubacteriales bacterium]